MTVSFELSDDLVQRLRLIAERRERPARDEFEEAIRQYVEREEARADFVAEALASLEDFERTGLHLTGEEVQDWLARWGTDGEVEPPRCHR